MIIKSTLESDDPVIEISSKLSPLVPITKDNMLLLAQKKAEQVNIDVLADRWKLMESIIQGFSDTDSDKDHPFFYFRDEKELDAVLSGLVLCINRKTAPNQVRKLLTNENFWHFGAVGMSLMTDVPNKSEFLLWFFQQDISLRMDALCLDKEALILYYKGEISRDTLEERVIIKSMETLKPLNEVANLVGLAVVVGFIPEFKRRGLITDKEEQELQALLTSHGALRSDIAPTNENEFTANTESNCQTVLAQVREILQGKMEKIGMISFERGGRIISTILLTTLFQDALLAGKRNILLSTKLETLSYTHAENMKGLDVKAIEHALEIFALKGDEIILLIDLLGSMARKSELPRTLESIAKLGNHNFEESQFLTVGVDEPMRIALANILPRWVTNRLKEIDNKDESGILGRYVGIPIENGSSLYTIYLPLLWRAFGRSKSPEILRARLHRLYNSADQNIH